MDELSDILYKGGYCDLNQSDNCKRGMAIIQRKLTDCDIISRAINESDKLNPAGDDEDLAFGGMMKVSALKKEC